MLSDRSVPSNPSPPIRPVQTLLAASQDAFQRQSEPAALGVVPASGGSITWEHARNIGSQAPARGSPPSALQQAVQLGLRITSLCTATRSSKQL